MKLHQNEIQTFHTGMFRCSLLSCREVWILCTLGFLRKSKILDFFRHTAATMLLMNELPVKSVSARLGHANAVITSQIYSHALRSVDEKAAEIMEGIFTKKTRNPDVKRHG